MNKVVRNYPVDALPMDLRDGLPEHGRVEIEIRLKDKVASRVRLADLVGTAPNVHGSEEEVVRHVRLLRGDE